MLSLRMVTMFSCALLMILVQASSPCTEVPHRRESFLPFGLVSTISAAIIYGWLTRHKSLPPAVIMTVLSLLVDALSTVTAAGGILKVLRGPWLSSSQHTHNTTD
jgi:hypothetical protein